MGALAPIIPAQQDFSVQRGSAGAYALISAQVKNPDGSLVDLTGATVEIITSLAGVSVTSADGSLTVDLPTSTFFWYPTIQQTSVIPLGRVTSYTAWITFPGGSRGPYLEGYLDGDGTTGAQTAATIVLQGPQGPVGPAGAGIFQDVLPITVQNVIPPLTKAWQQIPGAFANIIIGAATFVHGTGAVVFTHGSDKVAFFPDVAGFNLDPGDIVIAQYST